MSDAGTFKYWCTCTKPRQKQLTHTQVTRNNKLRRKRKKTYERYDINDISNKQEKLNQLPRTTQSEINTIQERVQIMSETLNIPIPIRTDGVVKSRGGLPTYIKQTITDDIHQ